MFALHRHHFVENILSVSYHTSPWSVGCGKRNPFFFCIFKSCFFFVHENRLLYNMKAVFLFCLYMIQVACFKVKYDTGVRQTTPVSPHPKLNLSPRRGMFVFFFPRLRGKTACMILYDTPKEICSPSCLRDPRPVRLTFTVP